MNHPEYSFIEAESFIPSDLSGRKGLVHIRPLPGQSPYETWMFVECSRAMTDTNRYPLGTRFRIKAKIVDYHTGATFVYSHYTWPFEVLGLPKD